MEAYDCKEKEIGCSEKDELTASASEINQEYRVGNMASKDTTSDSEESFRSNVSLEETRVKSKSKWKINSKASSTHKQTGEKPKGITKLYSKCKKVFSKGKKKKGEQSFSSGEASSASNTSSQVANIDNQATGSSESLVQTWISTEAEEALIQENHHKLETEPQTEANEDDIRQHKSTKVCDILKEDLAEIRTEDNLQIPPKSDLNIEPLMDDLPKSDFSITDSSEETTGNSNDLLAIENSISQIKYSITDSSEETTGNSNEMLAIENSIPQIKYSITDSSEETTGNSNEMLAIENSISQSKTQLDYHVSCILPVPCYKLPSTNNESTVNHTVLSAVNGLPAQQLKCADDMALVSNQYHINMSSVQHRKQLKQKLNTNRVCVNISKETLQQLQQMQDHDLLRIKQAFFSHNADLLNSKMVLLRIDNENNPQSTLIENYKSSYPALATLHGNSSINNRRVIQVEEIPSEADVNNGSITLYNSSLKLPIIHVTELPSNILSGEFRFFTVY